MVLKVNGKVICESKAVYNAANIADGGAKTVGGMSGMISDMTMCVEPVDVKKGDVVSMEADYDTDLHAE
jgi:hypothetical protein